MSTATIHTCPNCHSAAPENGRFCGSCGIPVANVSTTPEPDRPAVSDQLTEYTNVAAEKVKRAWGIDSVKAPLISLGTSLVALFLPLVNIETPLSDGNASVMSIAGVSPVLILLVGVLAFVAIVFHATRPERPSWPMMAVSGLGFAMTVPAIALCGLALVASDGLGSVMGDSDLVGMSLGLGGYILVPATIALTLTPIMALIDLARNGE